ncbi:MAG TPA: ATP-grasp domain-containing protein [Solirubrobacteraceae bacterium]|jgi:ribosomal protein S6--L-glutamate ligase
MRLFFMVVRRVPPVPSPVLLEVYDILTRRGYDVSDAIAEEQLQRPDRLEPRHDLYLLKSHTDLSLSLAGVLHVQGARLLNPYPNCAATQNKFIASRILRAAGVPTPRTWAMTDPALLEPELDRCPLLVKPYMGHRGAGIHIAHDGAALAAAAASGDYPMIVQEFVPGPGEDLKVYVVGEQVFAVSKPFSESSFTVPGRPVPVEPEVRDAALRTGAALGLGLFGLDVIESPDGPVVVDVNYFPGYKGVPDAAAMIADYIDAYAQGEISLPAPSIAGLAAPRPAAMG